MFIAFITLSLQESTPLGNSIIDIWLTYALSHVLHANLNLRNSHYMNKRQHPSYSQITTKHMMLDSKIVHI